MNLLAKVIRWQDRLARLEKEVADDKSLSPASRERLHQDIARAQEVARRLKAEAEKAPETV